MIHLETAARYRHRRDVTRGSIEAVMLHDWGICIRSVAGFAASSMLGIGVPLLIVCIVAHG